MTSAPDFNASCGHSVPLGARFCPECGTSLPVNPAPAPAPAPAPIAAASADPPQQPVPPRWPWEINDDDELHAVESDPTVVPPYYATQADARSTGPLPKGPTGPPRGGRRSLWLIVVGCVAVVVIVAAGVVILTRHPGKTNADAGARTNATHTAKPTPTASPTPNLAQLQATPKGKAAIALSALLQQAVLQLGDINGAISDVRACGSHLRANAVTFANAVGDRQQLLSKLAALPGRSELPAVMLQDLTSGWQTSVEEYKDLGRWVNDAIAGGCHKSTISANSNYRAAQGPGGQATQDKLGFVGLWDPIAGEYHLPIYRSSLL